MTTQPSIAIIGAGPAGLSLARILYTLKVNVNIIIFEHDASPTSRVEQGGTLDLHYESGIAAIQKCNLWDEFLKHARFEGDELIIADKNATELIHSPASKTPTGTINPWDRPEIDRKILKEILLESIPKEFIRWDHHLRTVTEDGLLKFDNREKVEGPFDLIIGADGAWSKVRSRLTDVTPSYSGVSGYEMDIANPPKTCSHVDTLVGRGSYMAISDCMMLSAQRMGDNSLKVRSWYLSAEEEGKNLLEKQGKKAVLDNILLKYKGWAPEITEILKQGDLEGLHYWTLHELPVGSKWGHKQGFTLIGDAASLMTPFSGEGVNKAMRDSLELAEWIAKSQDSKEKNLTLDQAVKFYEEKMFPRAFKNQSDTMMNKKMMFGPEGGAGLLTAMLVSITSESDSIFIRMLGWSPFVAAAKTYFWVKCQIGWSIRTFWRRT